MTSQTVSVRDRRRLPFVMVTKAALEAIRSRFDGRRGQAALAVYIAIIECANDARSESFALSRAEIAVRGMVNVRSMDRYVPELEDLELLEVDSGKATGGINQWTLTDPEGCDSESQGVGPRVAGGTHSQSHPGDVKKKDKETSPDGEGDVDLVFREWVTETGRDTARTKLTADRRRRIQKALASHGLEVCLAAVRNIGADSWAAGENDRGRPFNDIEHALGTTKRIEEWASRQAAAKPGSERDKRRARRGEALSTLIKNGGAA